MRTSYKNRHFGIVLLTTVLLLCSSYAMGQDAMRVVTTSNLNLRAKPSTKSRVLDVVPMGDTLYVVMTSYNDWCMSEYKGHNGYLSTHYLRKVVPPIATNEKPERIKRSFGGRLGDVIWALVSIGVFFYLLYIALCIFIGSMSVLSTVFTRVFNILSIPISILNALQRILAKPWSILYKDNHFSDDTNSKLRILSAVMQIPFYILLFPVRLFNAAFYNLLIHIPFELHNYMIEIVCPSHKKEGGDGVKDWIIYLPWRIVKYMGWHAGLTIVESIVWTVIDTFVPALTLYHGTAEKAAQSIVQSPDRQTSYKKRDVGIWRVGGGNFAGDGIYFAPARSTAEHYACYGSLIICRVSLGNTLDLGIAPKHVFRACGHPNAHVVTKWGLNHHYTTGEWWRGDTGWWEYCMYDWQNRYNFSWRIRPLYVIRLDTRHIQRIPGGMSHWLFRTMVIDDILFTLRNLITRIFD